MKIAILAPLTRPIHPDTRGGRSRVVYDLIVNLKKNGHDITLYGTGDSKVPGELIEVVKKSVYNSPPAENTFYQQSIALAELTEKIRQDAEKYDIIHNHVLPEFFPLLISREIKTPIVTTPHLYLWPELSEIYKKFSNTFFVAISDYQRKKGAGINFVDRVYNGIEISEFDFNNTPKDYFLFFGRMKKFKDKNGQDIEPKGVLDAIKVCQLADVNLYIAGNVEDKNFYEEKIKPQLSNKIRFIGPVEAANPIGFKEKVELYKNAKGYFLLSHWDEGCPLGPLEAMACGVPVIANRRSSLPEIIKDNQTGFVVEENNISEAVEAVKKIDTLNRRSCREWVENKFTSKQMAENYEETYEKIINKEV